MLWKPGDRIYPYLNYCLFCLASNSDTSLILHFLNCIIEVYIVWKYYTVRAINRTLSQIMLLQARSARHDNKNHFYSWLCAHAQSVYESWKEQSWPRRSLRLVTDPGTSTVSMSPEWIIRCFQCHTTLLTFLPVRSTPRCSSPTCTREETPFSCYKWVEVHVRTCPHVWVIEGRERPDRTEVAPLIASLLLPPFFAHLHSSHYRLQRVRTEACIDLGINYWTLSSFTSSTVSDNLYIKEQRLTCQILPLSWVVMARYMRDTEKLSLEMQLQNLLLNHM